MDFDIWTINGKFIGKFFAQTGRQARDIASQHCGINMAFLRTYNVKFWD
jgi:hypothetical protein